MMKYVFLTCALVCLLAGSAFAVDEAQPLKNDCIRGTITSIDADSITIHAKGKDQTLKVNRETKFYGYILKVEKPYRSETSTTLAALKTALKNNKDGVQGAIEWKNDTALIVAFGNPKPRVIN